MEDGVVTALRCHQALAAAWFDVSKTSTFSRVSTPAEAVHALSLFVLTITGAVFLAIASLLTYALVKYRARPGDLVEPPQVFGSIQIELAWTIIPILIIVMLFLGTARVIFTVQDAPKPPSALDVVVVGHQFWWEFRYPKLGVVTANELHVPLSDPKAPTPTYLKLTSADVMHSFWIPRLAGKTDALPNRVNEMWVDPHVPGLYLGQCAQFCGPEHAKMLLRVYVDTPAQFATWVSDQRQSQRSATAALQAPVLVPTSTAGGVSTALAASAAINAQQGRHVFEQQACINCHNISGTVANGRYGPDLTHIASRETIGSGIAPNDHANLLSWITDPNDLKPGTLMPAMHLTDTQNKQIAAYLESLH